MICVQSIFTPNYIYLVLNHFVEVCTSHLEVGVFG